MGVDGECSEGVVHGVLERIGCCAGGRRERGGGRVGDVAVGS